MSTRGIKHNFSVGEFVLCFEPDPTKARVLYDAKILDTAITRGKNASRVPAYHVHFQGWNNSWDRVVGEKFILKNTEENRFLMKNLADTTKKYRINNSRNRRINEILRHAFHGRPPMMDSDSETDEESSETEDEESEKMNGNKLRNGNINGHDDKDQEKTESTDGSEASGGSKGSKGDEKKKKIIFELDIPEVLKDELEREYIAINREELFVKLPADPNIVTILEGFMKAFCVNILCGTPEKNRYLNKEGKCIPFDRNIPLCKELVDGLRICFDFTLPLILLYEAEKKQYFSITKTFQYKPPPKTESTQSPPVTPPAKRKQSSKCKPTHNKGETSPKIPKLIPAVPTKDKNAVENTEEVTPRRLTRHAALVDNTKKAQEKISEISSTSTEGEKEKEFEKREVLTRRELRRSRTMSGGSGTSPYVKLEPIHLSQEITESISSRRTDAPPPLLIPSAISHKQETNTPAESLASSVDSVPVSTTDFNMECVLSWRLLPDEVAQKVPPAPSLIYGAHHLLRLFVKLPDIVNSMNMEDKKMRVLQALLEHFMDYMSERREEMFPDSVFVSYNDSV